MRMRHFTGVQPQHLARFCTFDIGQFHTIRSPELDDDSQKGWSDVNHAVYYGQIKRKWHNVNNFNQSSIRR